MKRFAGLLSLLLLVAVCSNTISACGPSSLDPFFSFTRHADYPLEKFAAGRLGVVPPTFGRASLFAVYRELNDLKFTGGEQTEMVEYWHDRINLGIRSSNDDTEQSDTTVEPSGLEKWGTARKQILGDTAKLEVGYQWRIKDKNGYGYSFYLNCYDDAFDNAANTLNERILKFGADNADVREWLAGQDAVFSDCEEGTTIPAALADNRPQWLVKDREYQIGAAQFYIGDFAAARQTFERIAADKDSDYNRLANYLIARTFIRQASLTDGDDKSPETKAAISDFYNRAAMHLQKILSDNSMSEYHESAGDLLNLVKFRSQPIDRLRELSAKLLQTKENPYLRGELNEYLLLLDKVESEAVSSGAERAQAEAEKAGKNYDYDYNDKLRFADAPAHIHVDDLTDWLFVYQIQEQDAFLYSFKKFRDTNKLHWYLAALSKADVAVNANEIPVLLAEADKIANNSPASATVRFHQIRLLLEQNKRREARQKLDQILANNFEQLPLSSQNKFIALRMNAAQNLNEFLRYAQRKPAAFVLSHDRSEAGEDMQTLKKSDEDDIGGSVADWTNRTMFDRDSVEIFNRQMPLSMLRQAALSPQLPAHLKKFLTVAVWTRALIINNKQIETEFAPTVLQLAPEYKQFFARYVSADNPTERTAAVLIAVMRYPVIEPFVEAGYGREADSKPTTIDSIRGNWWCASVEKNAQHSGGYFERHSGGYFELYELKPLAPEFLTQTEKAAARRELEQMAGVGNSATFLAARALDFARKNPRFKDTPEILHLAVRATRYGCQDCATGKGSKAAFDLLRGDFPRNEFTKKTPYWFKDESCETNK